MVSLWQAVKFSLEERDHPSNPSGGDLWLWNRSALITSKCSLEWKSGIMLKRKGYYRKQKSYSNHMVWDEMRRYLIASRWEHWMKCKGFPGNQPQKVKQSLSMNSDFLFDIAFTCVFQQYPILLLWHSVDKGIRWPSFSKGDLGGKHGEVTASFLKQEDFHERLICFWIFQGITDLDLNCYLLPVLNYSISCTTETVIEFKWTSNLKEHLFLSFLSFSTFPHF